MTGTAKIETARAKLAAAEQRAGLARRRSEAATPGGLVGYDSAVMSGISRRASPKSDARRMAAYDAEAASFLALDKLQREVACLEKAAVREARDAADRAQVTPEGIRAAAYVRDSHGWHQVRRCNRTTVSVETGYSWVDRIAFGKILETRAGDS